MLSFFPLDVLDETWDVIDSVSEGFLTYSFKTNFVLLINLVKFSELPPVWERASNSAYHLLFRICYDMSVHLSV